MAMVAPDIAKSLMYEIQKIEQGTDLKRVSVITRVGMKIASSESDQMDADAETASSAALIDLAERLSQTTQHGSLREILVKAESGFVILQFINEEYMVFGGISNIMRVGFYMEFLRNAARRFAFILAGNVVTEALQKEIEAQKDRERKMKEEAAKPLAASFKMDKNVQSDMDAMKGVLDFLKDWGDDGGTTAAPDQNNIVGIDKDLLFEMDDLAPQPITADQMSQAQTGAAASIPLPATSTSPIPITTAPTPSTNDLDIGLPPEILATLDELSGSSNKAAPKKEQPKETNRFGIKLYDDEVPPVPLDDYISFEVGTLTQGAASQPAPDSSAPDVQDSLVYPTSPNESVEEEGNMGTEDVPLNPDGTPNFDAMASEYDDPDISLEEDAMLDALSQLGMAPDKKKK
jgi:predicted regulator of Ras-like GTPase activity (Roadblock/LC7/MglB family)